MSDYAMKKLHIYLDEELGKGARTDEQVKQAIKNAYKRVEQDWIKMASETFDKGYPQVAYVGSCALVAVVKDNKLYVANAGDSKGALMKTKDDGSYEYVKVSTTFNANKTYEQQRLRKEFPKEEDIVKCKRNDNKACYVKGNLMPTRALGDLRLKSPDFNFHSFPPDLGYRMPIPKFNGPYITYEPEIQVIELKKEDKYLILASDGLWDEISRKQAAELIKGKDSELKSVAGW